MGVETLTLAIEGLSQFFDGVLAISEVSFSVSPGNILAIVGPNASGKTTILNAVCGFIPPQGGSVRLHGRIVTALSPHARARMGLVRTFQVPRVFASLTTIENVLLASQERRDDGFVRTLIPTKGHRRRLSAQSEQSRVLVEDFGLTLHTDRAAGDLSHGERRLLELARAFALDGTCYLLDEPTAGLSIKARHRVMERIRQLREREKAVLLVEHNSQVVKDLADQVLLLANGRPLAYGDTASVLTSDEYRSAYAARH